MICIITSFLSFKLKMFSFCFLFRMSCWDVVPCHHAIVRLPLQWQEQEQESTRALHDQQSCKCIGACRSIIWWRLGYHNAKGGKVFPIAFRVFYSLTRDTFRYLETVLIQLLKGQWVQLASEGPPSSRPAVPPLTGAQFPQLPSSGSPNHRSPAPPTWNSKRKFPSENSEANVPKQAKQETNNFNQKQEACNKKQEAKHLKQETRNLKQETRNNKLESWNKKLETRNKKLETRHKKQYIWTRNKKFVTTISKPETRNTKLASWNKKQETWTKKQETPKRNNKQETWSLKQ